MIHLLFVQRRIADPIAQKVTVFEWVEGFYEEKIYEGDQAIASPIFAKVLFANLELTAAEVLQTHQN